MIYLQLFLSFLKIGAVLFWRRLRHAVTDPGRSSRSSRMAYHAGILGYCGRIPDDPRPIAINTATYVGYTSSGGKLGSVMATMALIIPSVVIMVLVSRFIINTATIRPFRGIFLGHSSRCCGTDRICRFGYGNA